MSNVNLILKTSTLPKPPKLLSPYKQLLLDKKPWGRYAAESIVGSTLPELDGNVSRDATANNVTSGIASGNGATNPISYLAGTTGSTMSWPTGSIPSTFTICSLTRYSDTGTRRRVLTDQTSNWVHGHLPGNQPGICYYNFYTSYGTSIPLQNWLNCCGTNDTNISIPNNIINNTIPSGIQNGGNSGGRLGINNGGRNEPSDFLFSQIIIFDQPLTLGELNVLSNAYQNYLLTGILDSPPPIPIPRILLWPVNMEILLGSIYNNYKRFQICLNYIASSTNDKISVNLSGLPFTNAYNLGGKNNSTVTIASITSFYTSSSIPQYYQFTPQQLVDIFINLIGLDGTNIDSTDEYIFSFNIIGDENFKINI